MAVGEPDLQAFTARLAEMHNGQRNYGVFRNGGLPVNAMANAKYFGATL